MDWLQDLLNTISKVLVLLSGKSINTFFFCELLLYEVCIELSVWFNVTKMYILSSSC
jgi:hypothetical protein